MLHRKKHYFQIRRAPNRDLFLKDLFYFWIETTIIDRIGLDTINRILDGIYSDLWKYVYIFYGCRKVTG